jgi:adenylate kinase
MLAEKFNLIHLSTGDILRKEINAGSDLGKLAQTYTDKGVLVPDEVVVDIIQSQIAQNPAAKGFIFDGFPRTIAQADALDKMMASNEIQITSMIALEVATEELVKRLQLRGESSGRADDQSIDVIRNRIEAYNLKTKPIIEYYNAQKKYRAVRGIGEIKEIFGLLCKCVDDLK